METKTTKRVKMLFHLILVTLLFLPIVNLNAAPQNKTNKTQNETLQSTNITPTSEAENQPATNATEAAESDSTSSFPHLQRALIIATIVNFMIIVFALLFYIVKRRMNQFSPAHLVRAQHDGS